MLSSTRKRAVIYARISKADSEVDKVENQVKELKKIAAHEGYEVVAVHTDDDISAYKGKNQRNGFIALIEGLKNGSYDVVLATEPSRLTRGSMTELEVLQVHCVRAKAVIHTRLNGVQDPSNSVSAAMMAIMDVISGLETETKIERQKARIRADLDAGIPTKGIRAFGWETDRITLRESEAEVVRQAVHSIINKGTTLWAVAQDWNARGIKTDGMSRPRKSKSDGEVRLPSPVWTSTTVRQILIRPRNAGLLINDGAEMPTSQIQPIISREELETLVTVIKGKATTKGPRPQYLLGGLLECPCGQRMHASKSVTGRKGKPRREYQVYRCRLYGFDKSQSHATINMHIPEKVVVEYVVSQIGLGKEELSPINETNVKRIQLEIAALDAKQAKTEDLFIENLGNSRLKGILRQINKDREELEKQLDAELAVETVPDEINGFLTEVKKLGSNPTFDDIETVFQQGEKAWNQLSMETRRAFLRGRYRIQVESGGRGYERVHISEK